MDDLDDRLHAALHEADRGHLDARADAVGRARVVAGVRARRARRARVAAGGAVVVVGLAITAVVVNRPAGPPSPSALSGRPAGSPAIRPVPEAVPGTAGSARPAPQSSPTAQAPSTTGPADRPTGLCVAVSVDGRQGTWCSGTAGQPPLAVGQTLQVLVPVDEALGPVQARGPALRAEGGDRFVAVAPGRSVLSLAGPAPTTWSVTVTVS